MNIMNRLSGFLSRKFLSPLVGTLCFVIWQNFLPMVPVEIFAAFTGILLSIFLGVEGVKDIMIALAKVKKED